MNQNIPGWVSVVINWIPLLLILGVWALFRFGISGNQKRIADALVS